MAANNLTDLRREVDELDRELVELVARRFDITRAIGEIKIRDGLSATHPDRRAHRAGLLKELSLRFGLDAGLVQRIYQPINEEVVDSHRRMGARDLSQDENKQWKP
ncbi:chorismate mutase [Variovorax sp. OV329]|uniref:chorismate mutase n=1 Tax=Variovorax sp. OV329 TaxID=1882825 RepID=UPI0008EAEC1F|nr:chorismate mutase [Variovorax sp. OV329]SFM92545.1 chorismate mutase [Variovorax sp. OV329]